MQSQLKPNNVKMSYKFLEFEFLTKKTASLAARVSISAHETVNVHISSMLAFTQWLPQILLLNYD